MKEVRKYIEQRQTGFSVHPFFSVLDESRSIEEVMNTATRLAFWVMAFQDVLRLNEKMITDPFLKKVARHHKAEDFGHELWFLADLAQFNPKELDVRTAFEASHAPTRDATYALVSEVFRANVDVLRIVLVQTLESSGHVFFERISRFVEAKGYAQRLKYFSDHHLKVEQAHAMFESRLEADLDAIVLFDGERREAIALVDRSYAAFQTMFDGLAAQLSAPQAISTSSASAPSSRSRLSPSTCG